MARTTKSTKLKATAQEYLIIVGAPSNTFNGYVFEDAAGNVQPVPPPKDITDAEMIPFLVGTPTEKHFTHDRYWANFIYSAVTLIESGRVRPRPGDILTYAIYVPGYEMREAIDYEASPYNGLNQTSSFVQGNVPYNRTVAADKQGRSTPTNPHISEAEGTKKPPPPTDRRINHEILMRTTNETGYDGGFMKRASYFGIYLALLQNVALRIAFGLPGINWMSSPPDLRVPPLKRVMVKILLFREPEELFSYIAAGTWTGTRWTHPMELHDESSAANAPDPNGDVNWFSAVNPGKTAHPDWSSTPAVNRSRVKLKRLDYFGHSNAHAFFLQYGLGNPKGVVPLGEVFFKTEDIPIVFPPGVFAADGVAQLWGCKLGLQFAVDLAPHTASTIACEGRTTFEHVLDDVNELPKPERDDLPFIIFRP
jgi:hypothetical protein